MAAPTDSVIFQLTQFESKGAPAALEDVKRKFPLHEAAESGNNDEVLKILSADATVINVLDDERWAALHYAAYNNHSNVIATLLQKGADREVGTNQIRILDKIRLWEKSTALHCAARKGSVMAVKALLDSSEHPHHESDRGSESSVPLTLVNAEDSHKQTPLHSASIEGHVEIVTILLESGAQESINHADNAGDTPLHWAVRGGSVEIVRLLLHYGAKEAINHANKRERTPLYLAVRGRSVEVVRILLENGAKESINKADNAGWTSLYLAVFNRSVEVVRVLVENGAKESINRANTKGWTPLHRGCFFGNLEVIKILIAEDSATAGLEKYNNDGNTPLMLAILEGYEDVVTAILMKFDHATTYKLLMTRNKDNTTPVREAIKRMPDTAAMMLDCCTEPDGVEASSSQRYYVTFHYNILEDSRDDNSSHSGVQVQVDTEVGGFTSESEPEGFDHRNLPLNLIAQSENLKLLKHPLVTYLVKRKWKVARVVYFIGLVYYCIFLAFLTAFALTAPSPLSESCHAINGTANSSFVNSCELSDSRRQFVFTAAIFVVLFALARLIVEVFQMYQHSVHYFTDPLNWMEVLMAVFAIIFAWVFNTDCLCTYHWQWQIGTIAVFLAWLDFIIFVQKLPTVGIYVAMLRDILWSFIKALPLAVMLVIAFALGFFMLFSEPGILRSPFSTPARALLSIIAYTAGEFDYNGVFRLTLGETEEDRDVEEIPFPLVSYILFVVFVIIMSILLTNLLTALAVGDTEKILQNAEAMNIVQKIQLVLSVDAILPAKLRRNLILDKERIYPNSDFSWLEWLQMNLKLHAALPKGIEISEVLKREDISLKGLAQKVQDMKQTMETVLKGDDNSLKGLTKKVEDVKQTLEKRNDEIKRFQDELNRSQDKLKQELKQSQEELKWSQDELKRSQDKLKQELKQSQEELKWSQDELKQSQEEIKKLMREVLQKLS